MRMLPKRVRWRKLAAALLGIVALSAVSYLVIANVFLQTRLLRNIVTDSSARFAGDASPADLTLEYRSAYSILPGRVHVEGLMMRGRERSVEWYFTLDHADVSISLVDLLRRSFRATTVRASGLAFRARFRLDRAAATADVIATLPAIAGFADPPLLDDGPAPAPLTDANYDLWSINLENVDVQHVREVWLHGVRSVGDTRQADPVYFITPFRIQPTSATLSHFRGVFVQQYRLPDPEQGYASALLLVGTFGP